jgi:hypothetical protein
VIFGLETKHLATRVLLLVSLLGLRGGSICGGGWEPRGLIPAIIKSYPANND